jgi:2-haloacid dehalogenase
VSSAASEPGDREVLAFDLYGTLVDPITISSELGQVLGDSDGREAARLWRLKQLEYSFRLTAMGHYADFRWVTARALDFVLASLGASLPDGQARRLIELYDELRPFPDAVPALRALADKGYVMTVLSNGSPAMIRNCLDNSGLDQPCRRPVRHDRRAARPHRGRPRPPACRVGRRDDHRVTRVRLPGSVCSRVCVPPTVQTDEFSLHLRGQVFGHGGAGQRDGGAHLGQVLEVTSPTACWQVRSPQGRIRKRIIWACRTRTR